MPQSDPKLLVSTEWLADHLSAPDVKVLDASMFLPGDPRDAKATYAETHIPGAIFFDIDEMSDKSNPLPHMLVVCPNGWPRIAPPMMKNRCCESVTLPDERTLRWCATSRRSPPH